jgi:hypothetical protein
MIKGGWQTQGRSLNHISEEGNEKGRVDVGDSEEDTKHRKEEGGRERIIGFQVYSNWF